MSTLFKKNGYLIQDVDSVMPFIKIDEYKGINAYFNYPLCGIESRECRALTNRQMSQKTDDGMYENLLFVSDVELLSELEEACQIYDINYRKLFIESGYEDEICDVAPKNAMFIGYEYCPFPLDCQIISDLQWFEPLFKFQKHLNSYGVFNDYLTAQEFKKEYDRYLASGVIGDGLEEAYICKVYVCSNED